MIAPVIYLPEAQADIDAAYAAYERQAVGLGQRFVDQLQAQVAGIRANPQLYAVPRYGVRAVTLRRFPYVAFYRIEPARVLIVAVQHNRRSSRAWRGRI